MRLGSRWRIILAGLICGVVGANVLGWYRDVRDNISCVSGSASDTAFCRSATLNSVGKVAVVAIPIIVLALGLLGLAIWALRPVKELSRTLERLGPQNLAERVQAPGTTDEVGRLGTSLNQLLDRVTESYESQRRFAANASHELRTPLATQRTLIEVSLSGQPTPSQLDLLATQLLRTNQRNEHLIEGLLVLSESDRGLMSEAPQRLDRIAQAVIDAYQQLAAQADVTLSGNLSERVVPGEQVLLERLVTNLVQNAIKYNRPGGHVVVSVGRQPGLTVANTGYPVPAEAVTGLFEPFRRLNPDRMNHSGGAGLGLTIARSITQAHKGTIHAVPGADGGLVVSVNLPS